MAAGDVGVRTINPSQPTLKENEPPFSLCVGHGFSSPPFASFFFVIFMCLAANGPKEANRPTEDFLSRMLAICASGGRKCKNKAQSRGEEGDWLASEPLTAAVGRSSLAGGGGYGRRRFVNHCHEGGGENRENEEGGFFLFSLSPPCSRSVRSSSASLLSVLLSGHRS